VALEQQVQVDQLVVLELLDQQGPLEELELLAHVVLQVQLAVLDQQEPQV